MEFSPSLTCPAGEWHVLYQHVGIRGEFYRTNNCIEFIRGVVGAMQSGEPFGVTLRREPWNWHDVFAIRVYGHWKEGRIIRFRHQLHIGYLPRNMARGVARKVGCFTPLGARLVAVEEYEGTDWKANAKRRRPTASA